MEQRRSALLEASRATAARVIPSRIFLLYRSIHFSAEEFSRMLMSVFGVNHVVIVLIAVFCAYASVRLDGLLAIGLGFVGLNSTVMLIVMMNMLANLNRRSKETLHALRRQATAVCSATRGSNYGVWLRRELRCLPDLRIRMGSIFFYDKPIVLTTLQIILQISINLLLLY